MSGSDYERMRADFFKEHRDIDERYGITYQEAETGAKAYKAVKGAFQAHDSGYGFWAFVFDFIMTAVTSGFWLIWIFVRGL
jgi:hypothetical protein